MKNSNIVKLCNISCILFTLGFIIDTILDYANYSMLNSAPFRLWVYINLIFYILPAFVIFVIGRRIKKKHEKSKFDTCVIEVSALTPDERLTHKKMLEEKSVDTGIDIFELVE